MTDDETPSSPPPRPDPVLDSSIELPEDEIQETTVRITVAPPPQENLG